MGMNHRPYAPRDRDSRPPYLYPDYRSTGPRGPAKPLVPLERSPSELTGPVYGHDAAGELDPDLTKNAAKNGEPPGERIVVTGRVLDEASGPVPRTLVEIWQANAAGRYIHEASRHGAPIDPDFLGAGRTLTDGEGRYRFISVKPGAYPWGDHDNAWRPNHIHFSLFGPGFATRLVTQMYFPGGPLLDLDPVFRSTPAGARGRLVSGFSLDATEPEFALGYAFDIVSRGPAGTPAEDTEDRA